MAQSPSLLQLATTIVLGEIDTQQQVHGHVLHHEPDHLGALEKHNDVVPPFAFVSMTVTMIKNLKVTIGRVATTNVPDGMDMKQKVHGHDLHHDPEHLHALEMYNDSQHWTTMALPPPASVSMTMTMINLKVIMGS